MRLSNSILILLILGAICIASTAQLPDNMRMSSNCSSIRSGENASVSSEVSPGNSSVAFILNWQNKTSILDMVLSAPDGKKIDSAVQSPIEYTKNDTMIQYIIPDPEPGNWIAKVTAGTTLEPEETYCVFTILTLAEPPMNNNESANVTQK